MKIVLIANDTNFIYNLRKEILDAFIGLGHEVFIVAKPIDYLDELAGLGCKLIPIEIQRQGKNPINDVRLFFQYLRILKKLKPDVVFTNNIKPNVYAGICCQLLNIKYINNICGLGTPLENPGFIKKIAIFLYTLGVRGANTVFFQNEDNVKFFQKNNIIKNRKRFVVLPGSGVNLEKHSLLDYPTDNKIKFLFVARILTAKGIDYYLAVAEKIKTVFPNVEFHVCGYCDDMRYIKILKEYQTRSIVIYHGGIKDLIPFYEMCSCLVHPSYYPEGMSNVLLEASAHGRPVITTDRPGCKEIVDDGINGFIVKVKDSSDLYEKITTFLHLSDVERKEMGLAGRRKVEKEFDRRLVVCKYLQELDNI